VGLCNAQVAVLHKLDCDLAAQMTLVRHAKQCYSQQVVIHCVDHHGDADQCRQLLTQPQAHSKVHMLELHALQLSNNEVHRLRSAAVLNPTPLGISAVRVASHMCMQLEQVKHQEYP